MLKKMMHPVLHFNKDTRKFLHTRDSGSRIGADPSLTGALTWLEWEDFFSTQQNKNLSLVRTIPNPIDQVWDDQPSRSQDKLEIHDVKYAGEHPILHNILRLFCTYSTYLCFNSRPL